MAWITYDYRCSECGLTEPHMVDKDNVPELTTCNECAGVAARILSIGTVMRSIIPSGTTKRFDGLREQSRLRKEERKARRSGDKKTLVKIAQERKKL